MRITFSDKEDIVGLPEVNIKNKVTAADMNEIKYAVNDISSEEYIKVLRQYSSDVEFRTGIKKVIFNGPATIVIWVDGSKTVVKCAEGDGYSKFSGLAIAMCKRMYGTDFKRIFNHFITKEETECHSSETTNSKQ